MAGTNLREAFMQAAMAAAAANPDALRLAHGEDDATTAAEPDAAHFLKFEGRRFGRDIELYGFMSEVMGEGNALVDFVQEIVLPLRGRAPEAFTAASAIAKKLGHEIYGADRADAWDAVFDETPAAPSP